MKKVFCFIGSCLLFVSCVSNTYYTGKADLYGTVYDSCLNSVPGFTVNVLSENGIFVCRSISDVSGRFVLRDIPPGVYRIQADAPDYESYQDTLHLTDRRQFLVIKTFSLNQLYELMNKSLDAYSFEEAELILARIKKINEKNIVVCMYEAIIHLKRRDYLKAKEIVLKTKKQFPNNQVLTEFAFLLNTKIGEEK